MPTLETADGKPVDVTPAGADAINAQFQASMNDDGPDEQAPPKRRPRAAADEAPKLRRGRPPKAEQARATPKAEEIKDDYTADAQSSVGTLWTVAASIGFTQPYALVIEGNSDALVSALAEGAKHNATVRRFISSGGNTWALQLASVGMTMSIQAWQLAKDPELRKEAAATTREHLKAAMKSRGIEVPEPAHEPVAA